MKWKMRTKETENNSDCGQMSERVDWCYGTRFGEYVLIALAIMLNAFLIGFGLTRLDPDG